MGSSTYTCIMKNYNKKLRSIDPMNEDAITNLKETEISRKGNVKAKRQSAVKWKAGTRKHVGYAGSEHGSHYGGSED